MLGNRQIAVCSIASQSGKNVKNIYQFELEGNSFLVNINMGAAVS
jgi:hypothetical protein